MEWLISASAAALVLLIGVSMSRRARRRRVEESEPVAPSPPAETQEVHQRVRRFLQTGSHRLVEPESSASDLRPGARTVLQAKDVAADAATLDAFLADVRDASGADEAVF